MINLLHLLILVKKRYTIILYLECHILYLECRILLECINTMIHCCNEMSDIITIEFGQKETVPMKQEEYLLIR